METAVKKKLKETKPVKNVQAKRSKASIHPRLQETSATIVSQPAANKTSPLKRPHPGDNLDESINTSKKKKVQTSLNVYFKK